MQLRFVGCGDAFGSGGRYNTCFHVTGESANFLIDCGASSLPALKRNGISRENIDLVLITHFHGDHFGGLPFLMLDTQFTRRTHPLVIAGPQGIERRLEQVMEALFENSSKRERRFDLRIVELNPEAPARFGAVDVMPFPVVHGDSGGPFLGYRIEAARNADLFVCEGFARDKPIKTHMSVALLESHLAEIAAKRVILTHMGEDMLARRQDVAIETAQDGLTVAF